MNALYAGLTKAGAVAKAKATLLGLAVATSTITHAQAARDRAVYDRSAPVAVEVVCGGQPAWHVAWAKLPGPGIYVDRDGLVAACYRPGSTSSA